MKKYSVKAYGDEYGLPTKRATITARSIEEALETAWSMFPEYDYDDVVVCEINVKLDDTDDATPKYTCEDCIHHNVCGYHITDETDLTVEECSHFKNKASFVEVVYCQDCIRCNKGFCTIRKGSWGETLKVGLHDFCSYGERR